MTATTITFRRATADDHKAVYSINEHIYNDTDPLSGEKLYQHHLTRPYNYAYIAVIDGRAVAFDLFTFHEASKTLIGRFARVCPDNQIKNLHRHLTAHGVKDVLSKRNDIKEIIYMKGNDGPKAKLWPNHALIDIFHASMFNFTPARDLLTRCQRITSLLPWQLTEANSKQKFELLTCSSIGRQLDGSERVTIDQIPYMTTPGNYSIIMENENPHVIVELFDGRYVSVSFGSVRGVSDPSNYVHTTSIAKMQRRSLLMHTDK
ncbi:PREDICTED: uncharacterized protein LOC106819877 [Priapulus caudatus]|uniref:Uncharacterized protein LOC106819877 n=1 Tax=Priapulus caudatus TaxID=37621 RepID=A0ABM1F666_PRICU|nr:PREDICTED: uncharacterized protein LOC106819877 [Priapulus caudatus]